MIAKLWSAGIIGIDGIPIEIEVDISPGLPAILVVGIPDVSVKESRERVKSAIRSSGYKFPVKRIVINLAPADIKKEGTIYDLPIAIAILAASEQIFPVNIEDYLILGELSLDGRIKGVKGVLPMVISASRDQKKKKVIVPYENAKEAGIVDGIEVYAVSTLQEAINLLTQTEQEKNIMPITISRDDLFKENSFYGLDFNEVKGQEFVKRALEIACAGAHNLLMIGPPGSGKSMLAKRIPTILPDLCFEEALEITKIHSIMGLVPKDKPIISTRPYRQPHHTISDVALVGGGSNPLPGEISLSHRGVLFLDELPEFKRSVLEVLRQPLEDNEVMISRVSRSITYPANFMLIAAMNPCPCGYLGHDTKECKCTSTQIQKYLSKVSGPLLDRIDIHVEVPALRYKNISDDSQGESSADIKKRVNKTREIQRERFKKIKNVNFNAHMENRHILKHCVVEPAAKKTLQMAIDELNFSARAYNKILKVSRTIADMQEQEVIKEEHLLEAIGYRSLDKEMFY